MQCNGTLMDAGIKAHMPFENNILSLKLLVVLTICSSRINGKDAGMTDKLCIAVSILVACHGLATLFLYKHTHKCNPRAKEKLVYFRKSMLYYSAYMVTTLYTATITLDGIGCCVNSV